MDGGGSRACALIGDQLALLAIKNSWAGIVVHGYIRDSAVISEMPVGIKALGTNPRKSDKQNRGEMNIKLTIAQITVKPEIGSTQMQMELSSPNKIFLTPK